MMQGSSPFEEPLIKSVLHRQQATEANPNETMAELGGGLALWPSYAEGLLELALNATSNASSVYHGEADDEQNSNKFILPWWRQIIWTVLFAGMIIVATGGNLIVIWIVLAHKRMRTVTNYFLVNLSIADAMVSTLNVIFNYTYMLNSHWPFGNLYCKISQFIAVVTICASVFTLMAISVDRYVAIVNPLRPRMGKRTTLCIAAGIWAFGFLMSFPMLMYYTTYTQNFTNGEVRIICYASWPDQGTEGQSYAEYLYNVFFMIATYFMPIGGMTYAYVRIGVELWGSQSIGEATQRQLDNIRNKRRVVKMMMVVVVIFAVCWLPFHVYFIVTSYLPELTNEPYIQELYLAIYWLAMSNSMYNPIIYCWMNSRFRRGFAQFFSWCPWVRVRHEPALSRSEAVTSRYSCAGSPEVRTRISRNGTMRLPLHLQATTAETTTTIAASRRASYVDGAAGVSGIAGTSCSGNNNNNNNNGSMSGGSALSENGGSTRRHQRRDNYRQRLPYTARFQKLDSEPDSS